MIACHRTEAEREQLILEHLPQVGLIARRIRERLPENVSLDDLISAGVIGLIRFLPFGVTPIGWGEALAVVGFVTAFWGVGMGVTQRNPKTVLAYSSVSQMGVVVAAIGMGIAGGIATTPTSAAYYALHHVLAKGALFLAVGVAARSGGAARAWVILPAVLLALGFGGLPLTGASRNRISRLPAASAMRRIAAGALVVRSI